MKHMLKKTRAISGVNGVVGIGDAGTVAPRDDPHGVDAAELQNNNGDASTEATETLGIACGELEGLGLTATVA